MNDRLIAQLEAHLEKITEGIFAHFFGRRVQAHDIVLHLVRALEDGLEPARDGDSRPLAPDEFTIRINPAILNQISGHYPTLPQVLSDQIIQLATSAGYRLKHSPRVYFAAAPELAGGQIMVIATHLLTQHSTTAALQPIEPATAHPGPINPQLIMSGHRTIPLGQAIVQIGRSTTNNIVLDDPHVSRTHAQIRLRFGHYVIFDTDSQTGTFVNDRRLREHRLQAGDVIRIGRTSLVYMEDDAEALDQTDSFNSV
jgi:hypothetical protein